MSDICLTKTEEAGEIPPAPSWRLYRAREERWPLDAYQTVYSQTAAIRNKSSRNAPTISQSRPSGLRVYFFFFFAGGVATYDHSAFAPVPTPRHTRASVDSRGTGPSSPPAALVR